MQKENATQFLCNYTASLRQNVAFFFAADAALAANNRGTRTMIKAVIAALAVSAMALCATSAMSAETSAAAKAAACMGCHGADGNSPADMWPKLAGQLPEYIAKQLQDFKAGRRKNEQMSPMAQALAEADIPEVAAYFSQQKVKPASGKQELLAAGERLYFKGKGRPDVVAACVGCHGQSGAGRNDWKETMQNPPVILAPAIGSQHPAYVAKQLLAYKSGERSNDPAKIMRDITARMSNEEILAVAEYVGTLKR